MNLASIPLELQAIPRWVVWGETKIPFCPNNPRRRASVTDAATWATFEQAVMAFKQGAFGGVGFVLSNSDRITAIDIDKIDLDENSGQQAQALLDSLGCGYIEISPSGGGLHGWGLADALPSGRRGRYAGLNVEVYSGARYITMTGNSLKSEPLTDLTGLHGVLDDLENLQKRTDVSRGVLRNTEAIDKATHQSLVVPELGEYLPRFLGERNRRIFDLARHLRSKYPAASKPELRAAIQQWHSLALPVIGTKDFSTTLSDFWRAWEKVRFPEGEGVLANLLEHVDVMNIPTAILELGHSEKVNRLIAICRLLAEQDKCGLFFISARKAGELIGLNHVDAAKAMLALCDDGILALSEKGAGTRASRYYWVWPD